MVREVTLAVQSVLCKAHMPNPSQGPSAHSHTLCPQHKGSPRTVQTVLGPAAGPLPTLPSWVAADPAARVLTTHSSAVIGSEAGSVLKELRNFIRGLCWHEEVLPFLKMVFPRAHAMIRLMSTYTQNLPVCKAPAGSSGTLSTALSAQHQGPQIPTGQSESSADLTFTGRYFRRVTQPLVYPTESAQLT